MPNLYIKSAIVATICVSAHQIYNMGASNPKLPQNGGKYGQKGQGISKAAATQQGLQRTYDLLSRLTLSNDGARLSKTLGSVLAPEFLFVDANRNEFSAEYFLKQVAVAPSAVKQCLACSNKIVGAKGTTNRVVVTVKSTYTMILKNNKGRLEGLSMSYDTWIRTGEKWKLKRTQTFKESIEINGRRVID